VKVLITSHYPANHPNNNQNCLGQTSCSGQPACGNGECCACLTENPAIDMSDQTLQQFGLSP